MGDNDNKFTPGASPNNTNGQTNGHSSAGKTETRTGTGTDNKEKLDTKVMGRKLIDNQFGPSPNVVDINIPPPKETKGKTKDKKTTKKETIPSDQVASVISAGFGIIATRAGGHWLVTQEEANSIAEPAARILDKLDIVQKLGPYADAISLLIATGMVVVPRIIISMSVKKKVKTVEPINQKRSDAENSGGISPGATTHDAPGIAGSLPGLA